jgi:hypothetical protein
MLRFLSRRKDMCVLCGVPFGGWWANPPAGVMRMTIWNRATRDNVETTQCGWLAVSGRDILKAS